MHAKHLPAFAVRNYLAESVLPFVLGHEAAGIGHREFLYGAPAAPDGLFFRESDSGDLRIGVNYARNGIVAHCIVLAEYGIHCHLALAGCRMRQH